MNDLQLLSLRATGLFSLLRDNSLIRNISIEQIAELVPDKPTFIFNTLKELQDAGVLLKNKENLYEVVTRGTIFENLKITPRKLEDRIYDLFSDDRTYSLIAWFLTESGLDFTTEKSLKDRVRSEYDAAGVVKLFEDNIIFASYYETVSKNPGKLLTMADVLESLNSRNK